MSAAPARYTTDATELMVPRILVLDDEKQIHASLRLRLGQLYELISCADPRDALERVRSERFDLCFADIHMPKMNGLQFIEAAQKIDPTLGFVVLSAFDSDENLRRAIPLQVYEFLPKPLPDRAGFEGRIPEWIDRTRRRRREQSLAERAHVVAQDLTTARLERDVEIVASETARDALLQTAGLLTTIQAHLVAVTSSLPARARGDGALSAMLRNLEEARRTADAAVNVTGTFFDSAYARRDSSPALVASGVRDATSIAMRMSAAPEHNKTVDPASLSDSLPVRDLSGIDFVLLMVPAIAAALALAPSGTTVRITAESAGRLEHVPRDPRYKGYLWINRKTSAASLPALALTIASAGPALEQGQAEAWLRGEYAPLSSISTRGMLQGLQKCRGTVGLAVPSEKRHFEMVLVLPT